MSIFKCSLAAGLALGSFSMANAQLFTDDFNRADAGTLGANWNMVSATTQIVSQKATNGASTPGLSTVVGFSAPVTIQSVSMDVSLSSASLGYVAAVLGYGSDDVFVKVQGSGSSFADYGFYHGNNSSGVSGGGFFALTTPFTSGRITVSMLSNDTAQLAIDTNFDGVADQTYTATGYSALSLGSGAGIGLYGAGTADNYRAAGSVPEPASMIAVGAGLFALILRRRK